MASTSEEDRLKAEIAKLSGAIQTHKQHQQQPYQSYGGAYSSRGRGHYPTAGPSSYRGAYTGGRGAFHAAGSASRGRGRGAATVPPRNRTLILNDSSKKAAASSSSGTASTNDTSYKPTHAEVSSSGSATAPSTSIANPSATGTSDGWIKRKSTHNMSLVSTSTFQRTEPARLAAMEATRKAKAEARAAASSSAANKKPPRSKGTKASSSVRRGDNMGEVVIDGVVFEFDPSGTKLVKKPIQPSSPSDTTQTSPQAAEQSTAVPLKTSINGQEYIRTKRGNLISAELLAKRKAQREAQAKMGRLDKMVGQISAIQATRNTKVKPGSRTLDAKKARTLCTFFNKTGQCKRGLSCPYMHDSSKIALCPKVLRPGGCTLPKGTCPLSHTVRAERVPHCVHFLRMGSCRNGDDCLYTHVELKDGVQTRICRDFSDYGWCERGKGCDERHTYECPDFVEKGKCERKGCKLVHVIRAQDHDTTTSAKDDEARMQDGDLFMRDDAAAAEASDHETQADGRAKRKRPLMDTELDEDQLLPDDNDEDEDADADEQVDFTNTEDSRRTKRRKAKAFTQQKDFISFDDEEDEEEEADDSEMNQGEEGSENEDEDEDEDEDAEVASVHSEDFELSDVENEEDDNDEESDRARTAGHQEDQDDDDDGDLVDRDL